MGGDIESAKAASQEMGESRLSKISSPSYLGHVSYARAWDLGARFSGLEAEDPYVTFVGLEPADDASQQSCFAAATRTEQTISVGNERMGR